MRTIRVKGTILEGRAEKLEQLYAAHADAGFRLALLLTGNGDRAQDLVQEAFVRVASRLGALRQEDRFRGYLLKTISNLARDSWRRKTPPLPTASSTTIPDLGEHDEMLRLLLALPLRQRTAIYLRYYLDMSEVEAAETLGCSLSAIKSLTHRALEALRQNMEVPR